MRFQSIADAMAGGETAGSQGNGCAVGRQATKPIPAQQADSGLRPNRLATPTPVGSVRIM